MNLVRRDRRARPQIGEPAVVGQMPERADAGAGARAQGEDGLFAEADVLVGELLQSGNVQEFLHDLPFVRREPIEMSPRQRRLLREHRAVVLDLPLLSLEFLGLEPAAAFREEAVVDGLLHRVQLLQHRADQAPDERRGVVEALVHRHRRRQDASSSFRTGVVVVVSGHCRSTGEAAVGFPHDALEPHSHRLNRVLADAALVGVADVR
mmetsp:Transcript_30238/g.92502  ORF Transcript_30238/g.92502 Transcript_30238/m.92502 type:complete len:208 (+) Transcript_30238:731-1354(+)